MVCRRRMAVFLLALAACATRKHMLARPLDSGAKGAYAAPFDQVKRAAYTVLSEVGYTVKDEKWDERSENAWVINSSQGLASGTAGKFARIVIQKTESEQTVYVLVESKVATRETAASDQDEALSLQARLGRHLGRK